MALAGTNLLALGDSKPDLTSTMLQVYDAMTDSKPPIASLIKQETKRRRKDFVCPTCKVDQLNDAAFHAHLKIHPLECLTCGKCFFKRANLALHMKIHLGIKNYKWVGWLNSLVIWLLCCVLYVSLLLFHLSAFWYTLYMPSTKSVLRGSIKIFVFFLMHCYLFHMT